MKDSSFDDVPPGSIPASKSGVYRRDHFAIRENVYRHQPMQTQQLRQNDAQPQQMR